MTGLLNVLTPIALLLVVICAAAWWLDLGARREEDK